MLKRWSEQRRRLPRVAKIRLGVKKQGPSGGDYPSDTDHFVLTDCPEVAEVYGQTPKELVACFPSNELEVVFPMRREAWKASKAKGPGGEQKSVLFCSSDGETADRIWLGTDEKGKAFDPQGAEIVGAMQESDRPEQGERFLMACPDAECPLAEQKKCKEVGRLNIVLPQVSWRGIYQIETSSANGFGNLLGFIEWMQQIYGGEIAWRPFLLKRVPKTVYPPGAKGGSIKYVLYAELPAKPVTNLILPPAAQVLGLLGAGAPMADRPPDLFPGRALVADTTGTLAVTISSSATPGNGGNEHDTRLDEAAQALGLSEGQVNAYLARAEGDVDAALGLMQTDADRAASTTGSASARTARRGNPAAKAAVEAHAAGKPPAIASKPLSTAPWPDDADAPFGPESEEEIQVSAAREGNAGDRGRAPTPAMTTTAPPPSPEPKKRGGLWR